MPLGKIYWLCIIGLFLVATSCNKEDESVSANPSSIQAYSIDGYLKDYYNKPVKGGLVSLSNGQTTVSDSLGHWSFKGLTKIITVTPTSSGAQFEPRSEIVSSSKTNLLFQDKVIQSANLPKVIDWLNAQKTQFGFVKSNFTSEQISLYDNALGALAFMALDDYASAAKIFDYFNNHIDDELVAPMGGFSQFRNLSGVPNRQSWLGDNAWLLIALNTYTLKYPTNQYQRLNTELSKWIRSLQNADGSISGGFDSNGNRIGIVTEGNLDAFNAILGYDDFHSKLLNYLKNNRYESTRNFLLCIPDNSPYRYALDNFSWGYSVLPAYSSSYLDAATGFFYTTKISTANGLEVSGYCFDADKDAVWPEGTGQMAVAYQLAGNKQKAEFLIKEMDKMVVRSIYNSNFSGIPYVSNRATGFGPDLLWQGSDMEPALSSAAWYILATHQFNPFEAGRNKTIPSADKFWN